MILPLKKHNYGTVIINLNNGKIIDILNTRDPKKIQKELNSYPNLRAISRDRGYSYKTVSKECCHIADRFHLIMNLSEAITKEIKNTIPIYIDVTNIENAKISIAKNLQENKKIYTEKQKKKQQLILTLKEEYNNGKSIRKIAIEYKLNRSTISKYINSKDIEAISVYDTTNRYYSYLDTYRNEIDELYKKTKNISEVYKKLKEAKVSLTYSTLRHYISKTNNNGLNKKNGTKNQDINKISRNQIIKYIFNWKYKEEILDYIDEIFNKYPKLKIYKTFYQRFKEYLTTLNTLCFLNLLSCRYDDSCINKFILSLKTDWEAVINAASYPLSNGVTEENVNKIKQIKRDMYGKASYELLRKKVIYQSLFF